MAANLFLSLGGLATVFASTDKINVTFRRAWTLWPGRIEARDLRVVFQDHNLQWSLDIARVSFDPELRELLHRTFHARDVRGEGAIFRVRHRVEPWSKDEPSVRALAPIPEFATPAVFEARVPPAPVSDADYRLWTVELDTVNVGVTEAWIQQFRYVGSGRASGAFRLRAARELWVGPASLKLEPGRLSVGEYVLSPDLAGRVDCVVHPFDVRRPDGREVLRFISAAVDLRAPHFSPAVVELFFPRADLHAKAEGGELLIAARAEHGMLASGSTIELRQQSLSVRHPLLELELERGTLIAKAGADGRGEVRLEAHGGKVRLAGVRGAPLSVDDLRGGVTSSSLDTTADWSLGPIMLETAELFVPDVSLFNRLFPHEDWRLSGGASRISASGSYAEGELSGDAALSLQGVKVASADTVLDVDGRATVACSRAKLATRSGVGRVTLVLKHAVLAADAGGKHLSARADNLSLSSKVVRLANGNLDVDMHASAKAIEGTYGREAFRGSAELELRGTSLDRAHGRGRIGLELAVRDFSAADSASDAACPWSTVAVAKLHGEALLRGEQDAHLRFSGALSKIKVAWGDFSTRAASAELVADSDQSPTLGRAGETLLALKLHGAKLESGSGAPLGWDATVPVLVVKAELGREQKTLAGPVQLVANGARARIGRTSFHADVAAAISIKLLELDERRALASASLRVSRLGMQLGTNEVKDWWADVAINSVDVSARENLDLVGAFRAKMRDALPALTALAKEGDLPGWVPDIFPLEKLEGSGTVERHCRRTALGLDFLRGGPFASSGRVESVTDAVRGAFVVRFAAGNPLSAGVHFDDEDSGVTLFAGKGWLDEQYAKLAARQGPKAQCLPEPPRCGR